MKNIIILILFFLSLFFLYRSCTKGYDNYAYFVHCKNVSLFETPLSDSDPNIVDHGRKLIQDVMLIDLKIDKEDGSKEGLIRWYNCSGIDCDEGWQKSFY